MYPHTHSRWIVLHLNACDWLTLELFIDQQCVVSWAGFKHRHLLKLSRWFLREAEFANEHPRPSEPAKKQGCRKRGSRQLQAPEAGRVYGTPHPKADVHLLAPIPPVSTLPGGENALGRDFLRVPISPRVTTGCRCIGWGCSVSRRRSLVRMTRFSLCSIYKDKKQLAPGWASDPKGSVKAGFNCF